eukprot:COSAG05_NODE_17441_length_325_cov_0.712389_1_plen_97_part_10
MVCRRRHIEPFFERSLPPAVYDNSDKSPAAVPSTSPIIASGGGGRRREEQKPARQRGRRLDSEVMYTANGEAERLSSLVPSGLTSGSESEYNRDAER